MTPIRASCFTTGLRRLIAQAFLVGVTAVAAGCDDSETVPPELTFEVLFAGIEELRDSFPRDRLDKLETDLAVAPADVLCMQGIWRATDRKKLGDALVHTYPWSLDLPTNDTADGTEPAEESPPCGEAEREDLEASIDCVAHECSTKTPGDPSGSATSSLCVAVHCPLDPSRPRDRCHQCFHTHWRSGATFGQIRDRCATMSKPLGHAGEHGLLILSRLPLESPSLHVLPSEGVRRAVIGATVRAPDAGAVQVYCTALGPTEDGGLPGDPYTGDPYQGQDGDDVTGWETEQNLQVMKLIAHVQSTTGDGKAVVLGNFNAGPEREENGQVLAGRGLSSLKLFSDEHFIDGTAADYEPVCTLCPENPLPRDDTWKDERTALDKYAALPLPEPTWVNHIFLLGFQGSPVRSSVRTHIGKIVSVKESELLDDWPGFGQAPGAAVPVSVQYGFRSRIAVPR